MLNKDEQLGKCRLIYFQKSKMSSMSKVSSSVAGQRRLAYQCLRCLHRDGKTKIGPKYRIHDHFLVQHVPLDETPYHCKLCHFVARKEEDLLRHTSSYPRHQMILKEKGLKEDPAMLVVNNKPYVITTRDVAALTPGESKAHWETRCRPDMMQQAIDAVFGEELRTPPQMSSALHPTPIVGTTTQTTQTEQQVPLSSPHIIDLQAVLQPLQQLAAVFGGGLAAATHLAPQQAVTAEPVSNTPATPEPAQLSPVRATSPVPSVADGLMNLPTREECRALAKQEEADCASSTDCSSASECHHHQLIISELRSVRAAVTSLEGKLQQQHGAMQQMAAKLLDLAGKIAFPRQEPQLELSRNRQVKRDRSPLHRQERRQDRRYRPNHPYRSGRDDRHT